MWNPVIDVINKLSKKDELTDKEKYFLETVVYSGPVFRLQKYYKRNKGHICELGYFQSWSKSIDGVNNVTNLEGEVILIEGTAINGIDVFGLLCILLEYNMDIIMEYWGTGRDVGGLRRYEEEEEIVCPVELKNIVGVKVIDKNLNGKCIRIIPREDWVRKKL